MQHLSNSAQLRLKESSLLEALERLGGVQPAEQLPSIQGSPWSYRRRARLGVKYVAGKGRVLVGFRERFKPFITDMLSCNTLVPELAALLVPLSDLIGSLDLRERIPQIEASRSADRSSLVFRILDAPTPRDLVSLAGFSQQHDVEVLLQTSGPESVRNLDGERPRCLYYTVDTPPLQLGFSAGDFIQVNDEVNQQLVARTIELAAPEPGDRVLDLFCGLGNFSLPLARRAGQVNGVELSDGMVQTARRNASQNGIDNAQFFCEDLSRSLKEPLWLKAGTDLAVLDPPRAGAREVLGLLAGAGPRRIVYISCHPATLARDAGILVNDTGYRLSAAGVVDMFPQTAHAEAIAVFDRA